MPRAASSPEHNSEPTPSSRPRRRSDGWRTFLKKHREIWFGLAIGVLSSFMAARIETILSFVTAGRLDYEQRTQTMIVRTFPVKNSKVPTGEIDKYMETFDPGSISGSEGFLVQAFLTIGPQDGSVDSKNGTQWIIEELTIHYLNRLGENFVIDHTQTVSDLTGSKVAAPERNLNCEIRYSWTLANQPTVKKLTDLRAPAEPQTAQLPYLVVNVTTEKKSIFGDSCNLES